MIKAEIISHEGTPGPNWLDRCRALITPTSISTLVVVVAILGVVIAAQIKNSNDTQQRSSASSNSQPAPTVAPLTVQAASAGTYQAANGTATVQSAGDSNTANNAADASIRNGNAPLNATATTPDASQQSIFDQQTGLSGRNLTNLNL